MWSRTPPVLHNAADHLGVHVDSTKLRNAGFEHLSVGDFGGTFALGVVGIVAWGEKRAVFQQLDQEYHLNNQLQEVQRMEVLEDGGFERYVISFLIVDTKAQVALGGCSAF